jgi:hypothetical protein
MRRMFFLNSLTTGFVEKLSEAEKAEEALGDKEGYDAIAPQKDRKTTSERKSTDGTLS